MCVFVLPTLISVWICIAGHEQHLAGLLIHSNYQYILLLALNCGFKRLPIQPLGGILLEEYLERKGRHQDSRGRAQLM